MLDSAGAHGPFDRGLLADGLAPCVRLIYARSSQALDGIALLEAIAAKAPARAGDSAFPPARARCQRTGARGPHG